MDQEKKASELDIEVGGWPTISGATVALYLRPAAERECGRPLVYSFGHVGVGCPEAAWNHRELYLGGVPIECDPDSLRAWLEERADAILGIASEYSGTEINAHGNRIGDWGAVEGPDSDPSDRLDIQRAIDYGELACYWNANEYLCADVNSVVERVKAHGLDEAVTIEIEEASEQGVLLRKEDVRDCIESFVASAVEQGTHAWVETMPDHLRDAHRAARNWGEYPRNGSVRQLVEMEEADDIVANDPDGYARIVGSELNGEPYVMFRIVPAEDLKDFHAVGIDANAFQSEARAEKAIEELRAMGGQWDRDWIVVSTPRDAAALRRAGER